ncbi:uncharacterized protein LOC123501405 [Portunus trituberculatus]|uniref:uncharacterized protein LOC123501405 n=1 Tax=Portunus trituberculatus TaxID=210409 RepID=UPI001E1CD95D|nr:uncharacterized protein LOC123501405 [Portunus trituberculatus]
MKILLVLVGLLLVIPARGQKLMLLSVWAHTAKQLKALKKLSLNANYEFIKLSVKMGKNDILVNSSHLIKLANALDEANINWTVNDFSKLVNKTLVVPSHSL